MAISIGQKAFASAANNPITGAVTTQAAGSSFLAITIYDGSFTSYTDSKSNSYSSVLAAASPSNFYTGTKIRVDLCTNGTGGSGHTLRANTSGAAAATVHLIEILGGVTASLVDKAIAAVEDSASPYTTGATGTLSQADELVIAAYLSDAPGGTETYTWGNSFTVVQSEGDSTNFWANTVGSLVVSATTSVTASLTKSTGVRAFGLILSLKAAAAGGGTTTKVMSDTTTVSDAFNDPVQRVRQMSDTTVLSDSVIPVRRFVRLIGDALTVIDNVVKSVIAAGSTTYTKVMSDTLVAADFAVQWMRRVRGQIDTITLSDGDTYRTSLVTATETLDVTDAFVSWRRLKRLAQDNIDIIDGFSKTLAGAGIVYAKVMSDTVTLIDDAGRRWLLRTSRLTDSLSLSDAVISVVTSAAIYTRVMSDTLSLSDQAIRYIRAVRSLGDVVEFSDGTVKVRQTIKSMDESIEVSDERLSTLHLDQMSNTSFSFGSSGPPFNFGSNGSPFSFGVT